MARTSDGPARRAPLTVTPTYRNIWRERFDQLAATVNSMAAAMTDTGQMLAQTGTVGPQPVSGHTVVTLDDAGRIVPASNLEPSQAMGPFWLTTAAAAAGAQVPIMSSGSMTEPSWTWQVGPIYVGANGSLTQTPPTAPAYLAALGYATTTTSLVLNRQPSIVLA